MDDFNADYTDLISSHIKGLDAEIVGVNFAVNTSVHWQQD